MNFEEITKIIEKNTLIEKMLYQNNLPNDFLFIKEAIQTIKKLIKEDLNEALKYCEREEFTEYFIIQVQRLKILLMLNRPLEVIKICNEELYKSSIEMQYQHVLALINITNYNEALNLCDNYPNSLPLQTLKIQILMATDIETAYNFSMKLAFNGYMPIELLRIDILVSLDKIDDALTYINSSKYRSSMQFMKKKQEILRKRKNQKNR